MGEKLTQGQTDQINGALESGNKIEAIKLYRKATGLGLKESKDYIDTLIPMLMEREPEKYAALSGAQGAGCRSTAVLFFSLTAVSIAWIIKLII